MKRNLLFVAMFVCFVVLLAGVWLPVPVSFRGWVLLISIALLIVAVVTDPPPPAAPTV